jgi:hypothetical protein
MLVLLHEETLVHSKIIGVEHSYNVMRNAKPKAVVFAAKIKGNVVSKAAVTNILE